MVTQLSTFTLSEIVVKQFLFTFSELIKRNYLVEYRLPEY